MTRDSWQVRALLAARGLEQAVVLSMLAHSYDDDMLRILNIAYPGFVSISAPFLGTAGKVDKRGRICADIIFDDQPPMKLQPLYASEIHFRDAMRRIADQLKLSDADRIEMFDVAQRWIVCDFRLDPTMNPQDPDAKRLTVN
jgi:hypothetical protein